MHHPLARSSDPLTSFEAADRVREFKASQELIILSVLRKYGPTGASGVAANCELLAHQILKRLPELERNGEIELTGRTVKSESGRNEREWCVV